MSKPKKSTAAKAESAPKKKWKVRPDRSAIQGRFFHPRHEDGRCVGVPLDVTHGAKSAGTESEVDASDSGAER